MFVESTEIDGLEDQHSPSTEPFAPLCHSASMFQLYPGEINFWILSPEIAHEADKEA